MPSGTGSGVLAIWAAHAGAAKVFAIEYTDMANHARTLVEANGLSDVVEVIQSSAEDLQLPCKVDIIVSEWMGYFLLRESMLDSVIRARNKWLKPEGTMVQRIPNILFVRHLLILTLRAVNSSRRTRLCYFLWYPTKKIEEGS